ncbi:isoprenoid synthase domain-containing protein [Piptocephalis cylindrospora]|uniref:Isoprenoid synthase domain-containing protein n=1 Tax=Piptocephalis cylindrospora TaxID=1907219 RepID=A0A4P9Y2Z6_9FUNG|nr:isoprenoid synthase domain-containing protein [Piptocephalis cylindrospora]|eukprot:RKP13247.1 isoprenoid synthase domain-containing protein [Piptocephalis cylindrospora]
MTISYDEFISVYQQIEVEIMEDLPSSIFPKETREWIKDLMSSSVTKGKLLRGRTVIDTLAIILGRELTSEEIRKASIAGWVLEFLQTSSLIADDIMDESLTRRGDVCRHRQPEVGMIAINDLLFLECTAYRMIRRHFKGTSAYVPIFELCHEITWFTEVGQLTDALFAKKADADMDRITMEDYKTIAEHKSGYNTFFGPICLAMALNGEVRKEAYDQARQLLLPLGEFFQAQDDYLDCFADPAISGKIGTDIQDNKASWLIIKALGIASPQQRLILKENYGKNDAACIKAVKSIYRELDLPGLFHEYEESSYERMKEMVLASDSSLLPHRFISVEGLYKVIAIILTVDKIIMVPLPHIKKVISNAGRGWKSGNGREEVDEGSGHGGMMVSVYERVWRRRCKAQVAKERRKGIRTRWRKRQRGEQPEPGGIDASREGREDDGNLGTRGNMPLPGDDGMPPCIPSSPNHPTRPQWWRTFLQVKGARRGPSPWYHAC